jgi:hypothetical protein
MLNLLLALLLSLPAVTPDQPAQAVELPAPATPYAAWTQPGLVYLRHHPKLSSELAGALRHGDVVQVLEVVGDKQHKHPWALINGGGALALSALKPLAGERPAEDAFTASDAKFVYGRVIRPHAPVYVAPFPHAAVHRHEKSTYLLAFVPNPELQATGWLRRAAGGYMQVRDMQMLTASLFHGEAKPVLPLAFVRRKAKLLGPDKKLPQFVARYDRLHVLGERAGKVQVAGGQIARQFVRMALLRARPKQIPKHAKWIRIDLAEQTLVAYEGDTPVFATLVSTGKDPHPTQKGVFRIYAKTIHSTMRGRGWADYVAEEVPWAMHFYIGQALHGAYWHDQFGIVKSHGCVNLSPADAKWLFDWVPPALPDGWHTLLPGSQDPAVYVVVDKGESMDHVEPEPNKPTDTHQWTVDHQGGKKIERKDVDKE